MSAAKKSQRNAKLDPPPASSSAPAEPEWRGLARGGLLGCGVLLLFLVVLMVVLWANKDAYIRYGLGLNLNSIQKQIDLDRGLPQEQFEELMIYLKSLREFVRSNPMDQPTLARYQGIALVFQKALADRKISRGEADDIRAAVWTSQIPILMPEKGKK